ncbi:unnamed protein product [Ilex paraguariensis]|uniref:Transcription initiation factor TFIID subunit 8 n=1 Tax=Ilex paraguariensis TaxID=185542 RepID=A0ABC8UY96_9AQUA
MSYGGGENGRDSEHRITTTRRKSGKDEFARSIARIAVAQVCESAGFQSFQQSAFDIFSDVAVRYIREIGKTANYCANLAGRTECNLFDIIQGLEDLGSVQGFSGASETNCCLKHSGILKEIAQFVGKAEEIPFAYSIPRFPVAREQKSNSGFEQVGEMPPSDDIPVWLPAFPDPETYTDLPSRNEREVETQAGKVEQVREFIKMERSLLNLQQKSAYNGSEVPLEVDQGDAVKVGRAVNSNPFLAAPLQHGEKEVSSVVLPARMWDEAVMQNHNFGVAENYASVMFAPAIKAVKRGLCDSEDSEEKALVDRKLTVQFKFGTGKKSSSRAMSLHNEGVEKHTSWFGNDKGKDDKKRRTEQILNPSMENPQELAQL